MISIAIDGPSASGKSTIAKELSKRLNITYVDTGALYRTIALACVKQNIDIENEKEVEDMLAKTNISLEYEQGKQIEILDNKDVSKEIRLPHVSEATSKISALKCVRDYLFSLQQRIAKEKDVVMDGRDIGTVILPNATVKIYIYATPHSRAQRRYKELLEKGINQPLNDVIEDMKQRDYRDSHRKIAPLKKADDAIEIDSTYLTLNETIDEVFNIITERIDTNG